MNIDAMWESLRGRNVQRITRTAADKVSRHAIILAGGSGRRLSQLTQALTGARLPKQFCGFDPDGMSMLQHSAERAQRIAGAQRTQIVVCAPHDRIAAHQLRTYQGMQLVTQPENRGSAIGLALALALVLAEHPGAQVVVLPVDVGMVDDDMLDEAIATAFNAIDADGDDPRCLVALTSEPNEGSTDSAERDAWLVPFGDSGSGVQRVKQVVAAPNATTARQLVGEGGALSTMIVVSGARALLDRIAQRAGPPVRMLRAWAALAGRQQSQLLARAYRGVQTLDFSRDVLEADDNLWMLTLPAAAGWTDLGREACLRAWVQRRSAHMRTRSTIPSVA